MESSTPLCLFTGRVEHQDGEYVLRVPEHEIDVGALEPGDTYRVGVYPSASTLPSTNRRHATETDQDAPTTRSGREGEPSTETRASSGATAPDADASTATDRTPDQPPVSEGETRRVQIEDVGDQGDGLARVGPGYVVFVPDTEVGQQPLVQITAVRENVAFAEVVEE